MKKRCYLYGSLMGTDLILNENSCPEMLVGKCGVSLVRKVEENKLDSGWIRCVCSGNSSEDLTCLRQSYFSEVEINMGVKGKPYDL